MNRAAPIFCWNNLKVSLGELRLLGKGHILDVERLALHANLGLIQFREITVSIDEAQHYLCTPSAHREPTPDFWQGANYSPLLALELPDGGNLLVDGLKRLKLASALMDRDPREKAPRVRIIQWADALAYIPTATNGCDPLREIGLKSLRQIEHAPSRLNTGRIDHVGVAAVHFDVAAHAPANSDDHKRVERELLRFVLRLLEAKKVAAERVGARYTEHDRADDAEFVLRQAPKPLVAAKLIDWKNAPLLAWDHLRKNLINKVFYNSLGYDDGDAFRQRVRSEVEGCSADELKANISRCEATAVALAKTMSRIATVQSRVKFLRQIEEGKGSLTEACAFQEHWSGHPAYTLTEIDIQETILVAYYTGVRLWPYYPQFAVMADALAFAAWLNGERDISQFPETDPSLAHALIARREIDAFGGDHQSPVWADIFQLAEKCGVSVERLDGAARAWFEHIKYAPTYNRAVSRLVDAVPTPFMSDKLNGTGRAFLRVKAMVSAAMKKFRDFTK